MTGQKRGGIKTPKGLPFNSPLGEFLFILCICFLSEDLGQDACSYDRNCAGYQGASFLIISFMFLSLCSDGDHNDSPDTNCTGSTRENYHCFPSLHIIGFLHCVEIVENIRFSRFAVPDLCPAFGFAVVVIFKPLTELRSVTDVEYVILHCFHHPVCLD